MPSPQKAKGSGWERDTARFLSGLYGESFIRAPGSGAYVGGSNKARMEVLHEGQIRAFKGDIVPGQSFPKLNAECKFYKAFPFHRLLQPEPLIESRLKLESTALTSIMSISFGPLFSIAISISIAWPCK